jgi:hypothetical protein
MDQILSRLLLDSGEKQERENGQRKGRASGTRKRQGRQRGRDSAEDIRRIGKKGESASGRKEGRDQGCEEERPGQKQGRITRGIAQEGAREDLKHLKTEAEARRTEGSTRAVKSHRK